MVQTKQNKCANGVTNRINVLVVSPYEIKVLVMSPNKINVLEVSQNEINAHVVSPNKPKGIGGIAPNQAIARSEFEVHVKCLRSECNEGCDCAYM